ncbi:polysaccharide ABC transporter ATP-binding protein [Bifidobacterium sp. ESL0764]|uniref:ABC transporter ATP-binding protein n=1 Tax=Bifidobacterium sp. ESL0764 TaxID=2983228 RepID=UPI0023F86750|nr:polysaccharide ABC transporter ATP-binding protein [Bifidobacterium sp. ESL0764]WEV66545.1 polysaccharide ABC transporter ATP-binding protein [Bifidobacterium sp. ESL0764]
MDKNGTAKDEAIRSRGESPVVLSVKNVSKSFRLPTEQATGIKMAFLNWTKGIKGYTEQKVLKDISFDVHQGDFFGIVGRNGSGKSTLLKIISGIYVPEQGTVDVTGKLVPFIELGVGFNPELTGRENVYLNGALLGFTHAEIDAMYDDIVQFAELEDFMDQKLKNYSSGMQVRLAFSVAIKAQGDILVLDEVLAVGDEAFQRKCDNFFAEVKQDPTKTVILVTHSMESVKKYCNDAILIKDGKIIASGNKNDVADRYTLENLKRKDKEKQVGESGGKAEAYETGLNKRVPILSVNPVSNQVVDGTEPFKFEIEYQFDEVGTDFYMAIAMYDVKRGGVVYDTGSKRLKMKEYGHVKVRYEIPLDPFNNGQFRIVTSLRTPNPLHDDTTDMVAFTSDENSCFFNISNKRNRDYALLSDRAMQVKELDTVKCPRED